jgi:hypothetical protein
MCNFRLSLKILLLAILPASCYLLAVTNCCAQETLTITTYYPSPSGSYNELTAHKIKIGATYSDSATSFVNDGLIVEGNVGIGTATPGARLQVESSANQEAARIVNSNASAGSHGLLINTANDSSGTYALDVRSNFSTKFIVKSDGNVGIGTDAPSGKLHLVQDGVSLILDNLNRNSALRSSLRFFEGGADSMSLSYDGSQQGNNNKLNIRDESSGSDLVTFTRGGNIGIGTVDPSSKLHILENNTGNSTRYLINLERTRSNGPGGSGIGAGIRFRLENAASQVIDAVRIAASLVVTTNGNEQGILRFFTISNGSLSEKMRIGSNGNVGIGTMTPQATLDINGDLIVTANRHSNCQWTGYNCSHECPDGQFVAGYDIWQGVEAGYECGAGWSSTRKFRIKCCEL